MFFVHPTERVCSPDTVSARVRSAESTHSIEYVGTSLRVVGVTLSHRSFQQKDGMYVYRDPVQVAVRFQPFSDDNTYPCSTVTTTNRNSGECPTTWNGHPDVNSCNTPTIVEATDCTGAGWGTYWCLLFAEWRDQPVYDRVARRMVVKKTESLFLI